jgi:hypothetical protein
MKGGTGLRQTNKIGPGMKEGDMNVNPGPHKLSCEVDKLAFRTTSDQTWDALQDLQATVRRSGWIFHVLG